MVEKSWFLLTTYFACIWLNAGDVRDVPRCEMYPVLVTTTIAFTILIVDLSKNKNLTKNSRLTLQPHLSNTEYLFIDYLTSHKVIIVALYRRNIPNRLGDTVHLLLPGLAIGRSDWQSSALEGWRMSSRRNASKRMLLRSDWSTQLIATDSIEDYSSTTMHWVCHPCECCSGYLMLPVKNHDYQGGHKLAF